MANNIYIWSTDSSLWESSGADIIYLATTPGANGDAGGQSKNIVGNNQTLQSTPLKDALLDIGSDNLVTLAGNYTGADNRTPYNLNYTAKLTLKEISGVRFSTGGKLNFSSQTGGPHTTADDGSALNDRNIKVNVVADNDAFAQGSSTAFGTTQNLSTNGFLSLAGTLTVTGDASANINVASRGNIAGLEDDQGNWVNNASSNILNASAYKAENFYITNNFTGTLTADARLKATSTVGATANSNTVQAHGVWGISSVKSDGYWGKKLDDGSYYGTIVATANNSNIRASITDTKPKEDGTYSDGAATATGNIIGAYGIRSGSDDPNNYSGSITLDSHNGLNGYYGYNGTITVSALNNTFYLKSQGDVGLTFSGNSVKAVGMASNSLTVNGMFLGEISATVDNTSFNLSGGNGTKWSVTNNDVLAAGIYTSTLVGNNTFAGNIQVTNTNFYLSATGPSDESTFARAYGIYASDITINGSLSGGTSGSLGYASGLLASNITVTTSISSGVGGLSAAVGIKSDTLTAEAFTGTITVDSGLSAVRNVGLDVSAFKNGNDSIFDMAGSITVNASDLMGSYPVIAGIMTQAAINMRISGDITVPVISGERNNVFAIYAGDMSSPNSYTPSGMNDNLTIAAGAVINGDIDLTTGTNYITVDSNASITGDLLATNGNLNLTILLNQYGSVGGENIATGDTAIIQSQGKMKGTAVTGLTINLNNAEVGKTYKIIEGVDWGQNDTPKEIGFLYNNTSAERKNVLVGEHIVGTLTGGGSTITYETWIENGALYVQVTDGTPTSAIAPITGFQGQVSDVPGQYQTVTFSWDDPTTFLATNAKYEFEYRIGTLTESGDYEWTNSIVVMLSNSARSYNVYNVQENQIVEARVRVNQSSGAYYSDWTSAEQIGGELAQVPLSVGKVTDGNTYFLDGNTQGATSTTMDFGWEDVSGDCSNGLQYYEMQYFVAKEDIAKEDWAELWTKLETLDPSYSASWGVDGTQITLSNGHTYTIFEHTSKTTTINHMLVSRMNDGQYVYWRVQAVDNENNVGGWTDGERFLVETRDTEAPVLNDPKPSMVTDNYPVYNPVWDPVTQTASSTVNISLQWTYNATDDVSGVNKYTWHYRLKGSNDEYKSISFEVSGYQFGGIMTEVINGLAPGIYEAYLTVFDNVLKESSDRYSMEWVLDVDAPTINIVNNPSTTTIDLNGYQIWTGESFVNVDQETINPGDMIDNDGRKVTNLLQNVSITINVADIVDSDSGLFYFKLCYEVVADASTGATTWKYLDSTEISSGMTTWTVNADLNVADSYKWMFVAYDKAGNASEYYFTSDGDSTAPVFVTDPTYDYTMNPSDSSLAAYTLRWDAAVDNGSTVNTGVAYYRIIFDSKLGLDDVVIAAVPGQSTYSYDLKDATGNWIWLPADTTYQIRIEAYDWLYNVMPSDDEKNKHMTSSVVNIVPDNDAPVFNPTMNYHVHYSVVDGALIQNVDLTWTSAEDSGAGVKGYWVMYRKQGESEWSEPVWAEHSAGTSKLTLTGLPDGNYEWQIYAVDKRGNESPLVSSTWQNDTQAPVFAEGSSGSHGDVSFVINNVGGESYAQMQVTISWTPAVDAQQTVGNDNLVDPSGIQGYIVEYRYKLPGDADFGAWYSVNSIDNLITGNSITLNSDNLLHNYANATYEWRIQAVDRTGNISSYLEGDSVEGWTGDITAPIFTSTDVTVTVDSNNNVTIDWKAAAQEDPAVTPQTGVKEYIFTLHKEGDPADKTFTVMLDDPNLSNYTFSSSFWDNYEDGTYTWSLVAVDYAGNVSSALTGDSFFIDLDAPHGPDGGEGHFTSLPAPTITVEYNKFPQPGIEGPEDPVEVRDPANITITFDASNHTYEDMTGVYFIYQISLDKTFQDDSKLVYNTLTESEFINTNVYEGDHLVLSTENNGITRLAGYAPGTTFYWRVKAVDGRGHEVANWSQQITPFQLKDSDGNDIVDIYTDPTTPENVSITVDADPNSSATHRISWIPSSDTFGIKGYNIEISNKMETTYLYLPADEFSRDDLYIGGAGLILNSGTYHFRVQAVDGSGRTSDWSEKVSYTVSEDVYTGDGSSSALAYVLDNTTPGTNYYTTSATGEVGFVNDQKINGLWYKFDLPNEGKLDINGRPLGGILNLSVASASTLTITICDDIEKKTIKKFTVKGGTNGVSNIIIDPAKYGDRIYVYVEAGKNVTRAQYTINANISFFESPDYDELKTNPTSIKLNSTDGAATASVQGWVGYQDKGDYYMFTGDAAATVQGIDITGVTGKLKVTLYDNAWKKKASVTISEDAYGLFSGQLIPEVYFVAVETTDSGKGKVNSYYNLNVSENYLPANKPSSNPGNVVSLDANGYYASTDEWVGYGDAMDYYSFSTTHAGALNVSINVKQNATLKVTLYQFVDGKQKKLKSVTVKSTTNNTNLFKDYLVPVGDFMITVESGDKGKGKQNSYYDLMVSDQYKHPASPNSSFATADQGTLVVNQPTTAANDLWVGYGDPVDYYEVNVAGDGVFNLGVYDLSAKVKVFVYEKDANGVAGKKIASATLNAGTSTNSAFKNNLMLTAGNYYVVVESADKKTAKQETAYNLNFNGTYFTNDNHLNDNSAWDVDTVAQAQTLAANETIQLSGWVGFNDASDFFRFELNGSSMVRLDFSNFNSTNLKYEVRSVETNKKVSFDQNGMSKEQLSGAYYVEISTKNEKKYYSNDYTLGITAV